jgi:ribose-phosphate pyrophosphokinase
MADFKIVTGRSNAPLALAIAREAGKRLAKVDIRRFSDGEIWVKYAENVRGVDVFIVQPTNPPAENMLELLQLIDAAKRASARSVTAVIPYFGYARQDRKDQPRVSITAKLVANLITTAGADRVIAMDLHAPQIQGFFDIPFDHLYSTGVLMKRFLRERLKDVVVASPDVGGLKLARAYGKLLEADLVFIDKRRPAHNIAEVVNIVGECKGKNVLIVDDLIDTGGTFVNAIVALKRKGAKRVFGACTHPILSGSAVQRLQNSPIEKLFVTDTVPLQAESKRIEVISVSKLFAEAIIRAHGNRSISSLFDINVS